MAAKLNLIWTFISHYKYLIVIVIGVAIVGFLDENSIWSHLRNKERMGELKSEIEQLNQEHAHNQEQIKLLDKDPKAIQKIARERYFMKADDEDIYVLSGDLQQTTQADETAQ